jgi:uncharacterized protein YyaL (SSP411 family)
MSNHLAATQSLYLRKHADNPINWWYWCPEALNLAKAEDKPIFLSIGYSSCHWCTVMEGEAFSDQAIADYLNNNYLPIKVDREERPDLDSIYMQALQMMTGQGGWPLNIFLTPDDLVPFYGGTYFPLEPKYGRPGFLQILEAIRRFYDTEKEKLATVKDEILTNLHNSTILNLNINNYLNSELLQQGLENNTAVVSHKDYGPSFPMIPYAQIALQTTKFNLDSPYNSQELSKQRGEDLSLGGIYDHVGGGFHRYTVDSNWTVPHFEKMLYDNGQIMEYLANLWSNNLQIPAFKTAIFGTVSWLQREMTASEGYFYASQDADNFVNKEADEPEEGAFYVWSYDNLEYLLTQEELQALQEEFYLTSQGNFEGFNVLKRRQGQKWSNTIDDTLNKLFKARYGGFKDEVGIFKVARNNQEATSQTWLGRIPPVTDTKMIVSWNSLMISGLAKSYGIFQQESHLNLAIQAANFILNNQWLNNRFYRLNYDGETTVLAQAEDYAFFIKALLDLYNCNPSNPWLAQAIKLQNEFDEYFWSVETGGYYNNSSDNSDDLLIREKAYIDNATPSANGIAISNLVRLALLTENQEYYQQAEQGLQAFAQIMAKSPTACPSLFTALNWYQNGTIVKTTQDNITELLREYLPTTVYQAIDDFPSDSFGLVCRGFSCLPPAKNKAELLTQINLTS